MSKKVDELLWTIKILKNDMEEMSNMNEKYRDEIKVSDINLLDLTEKNLEHEREIENTKDVIEIFKLKDGKYKTEREFLSFIKRYNFNEKDVTKIKKIINKVKE